MISKNTFPAFLFPFGYAVFFIIFKSFWSNCNFEKLSNISKLPLTMLSAKDSYVCKTRNYVLINSFGSKLISVSSIFKLGILQNTFLSSTPNLVVESLPSLCKLSDLLWMTYKSFLSGCFITRLRF